MAIADNTIPAKGTNEKMMDNKPKMNTRFESLAGSVTMTGGSCALHLGQVFSSPVILVPHCLQNLGLIIVCSLNT